MEYVQLIKSYWAIYLFIFIKRTWSIVMLATLIETSCMHAFNDHELELGLVSSKVDKDLSGTPCSRKQL